ncbi:MAG: hypothetical protein ACOCOD_05825, partial [Prevotella sp.]
RPPGYEPGELPTAPLRDVFTNFFCDWSLSFFATAKVHTFLLTTKFFLSFFSFLLEKLYLCPFI